MTFSMIHPIIFEVYVRTLQLDEYGSALDGYWETDQEVPAEIRLGIENAAAMFTLAENRALNILGSKEMIQDQLNLFHNRRGKA